MKITVIKSKNRRRTASARQHQDELIISVPWFLPTREVEKIIQHFARRFERKKINSDLDLSQRAQLLNQKYFAGVLNPFTINWSTRQKSIFGICNFRKREIRISSRLKNCPVWVIEATILHELAHLVYPNHSSKFKELIRRYPYTERAIGYLIALGMKNFEVEK